MQIEKMNPKYLQYAGNKRTAAKNPKLLELAKSIRAHGILQPIIVDEKGYIIAGRRRCAAAILAGLETVPVIVREHCDDAAEIKVVENLQREDLAPLEEAAEVRALLDRGWNVEDVAATIGKSPTWVVRRTALTKLSKKWQNALTGKTPDGDLEQIRTWPASYLELVSRLSEEQQEKLFEELLYRGIDGRRELEDWIADETRLLKDAPFPLDDETLNPKRGACVTCQDRSSCHPGLFDDWDLPEKKIRATDKCLNIECWEKKTEAWVEHRRAALVGEHGDAIIVNKQGTKGGVNEYDVERTKKGAKGARKVLDMQTGQEYWGKLRSWARPSKSRVGPDGKKKPSTLADRRKKLEKRREARVNEILQEHLEMIDIDLVASYYYKKNDSDLVLFGLLDSFYEGPIAMSRRWPNFEKINIDQCRIRLWNNLRETWIERLHFRKTPPKKEHEAICKFLSPVFEAQPAPGSSGRIFSPDFFNVKNIRAQVAEEIPEPKSWATLKADGTPKAKKKGKKAGGKK